MDARFLALDPADIPATKADALVLILGGETVPQDLPAPLRRAVETAIERDDFALKAGRCLVLHDVSGIKAPRLVLAAAAASTLKGACRALGAALAALKSGGAVHVAVACVHVDAEPGAFAEHAVLALADATYQYTHTKPSAAPAPRLAKLSLIGEKGDAKAVKQGLARGTAIAAGIALARECANRPGNHATPSFLAEEAKRIAQAHGMKTEILDRKAVEKLGMGAFLAVAQGSDEPLRFIVVRYDGAAKGEAPVVLVGKGITFDTGGISLKPGAEMDEMKFDMGGAASVLGALRAVGELKPRLNLVALIPACENMPSGHAIKPGDVVTSMSGQTIEILNTDAEGRLILCDALTYAERFKPAVVVDVATLTGACVIALGGVRSGMYASDDALAQALSAAGEAALDPCWRMPLDEEYDEQLKSHFADMANVGTRAGGSITAAKFLQRYAGQYRWGHLDIAGTAWKGGAAKGATGRPVGLLTHFVLSQAR